jgi:hypothetical protein
MQVAYKSDTHPDFALLEEALRQGLLGPMPHRWMHEAEQELDGLRIAMSNWAETVPWMSEAQKANLPQFEDVELPTHFDSPSQFRILTRLVERIQRAAETLGLEMGDFPHFACIPSGLVNASAVSINGSTRPFILFDSQLFLYCHLFAKCFARCLPIVSTGEQVSVSVDVENAKRRIDSVPELVERLVDLLLAYAGQGAPSASRPYPPEREYIGLIDVIRDGMELFIVAHELGHVYSGHVADMIRRFAVESEGDEASAEHVQEHEADLVGLLLTLQAMADAGFDPALSFVGVELFFKSLETASRAELVIKVGDDSSYIDEPSDSHPSNAARIELLRDALSTFIPGVDDLEAARGLGAQYGQVADVMWAAAKGKLATQRVDG